MAQQLRLLATRVNHEDQSSNPSASFLQMSLTLILQDPMASLGRHVRTGAHTHSCAHAHAEIIMNELIQKHELNFLK